MTSGNIRSYSCYGLTESELADYISILKNVSKDTPDGKVMLENGAFYSVQTATLKSADGRLFEAHRKYIDIQYVLSGKEDIEYCDLAMLTEKVAYSEERDYIGLEGRGTVLSLNEGDFAVFTPTDGHLPCIGEGTVKKIVIKVPVK